MTLKQAIKIVERHQRWRRDSNVPPKVKMQNPTKLGEAIDILLFIAKLEAKNGNVDKYHIHPRDL